jgi:DNA-binding transcriptional ArsR family regulator
MSSLSDNMERAELIAEILKALAHPLCIRILAILSGCVSASCIAKTGNSPHTWPFSCCPGRLVCSVQVGPASSETAC